MILKRLFGTLVVLLLLSYSMPLSAQNDTLDIQQHILDEVIVEKKYRPQTVKAVAPTQVLGREEIDELGMQNMGDAVRRFAGTNVRDYGGIGGLKTVSVRNLGAAHTAVSYDGVTVSNCQAGQIDIGRFSLDNVENLSLSVGHSDELLQSARHFTSAGVLNIQTERPHFGFGHNYQGMFQMRVGSFGMVSPSLRWWQRLGNRTSLSINGTYQRADGRYPFLLENGQFTAKQKRINTDIESCQTEANLYTTLRDSSHLNVKAYYFNSERGLPGNVILYNNTSRQRLWDENFFTQASYHKTFSPQWQLQVQAKYNHSWNKYEDVDVKYAGGSQTDIYRQDESYAQATALYKPNKEWTLSLAQDGFVNTLRSNMESFAFPTRYTSLTAANLRYQNQWLKATATLANTFIYEHLKVGDSPHNRERLSPTVSVAVQPWTNHLFFVRAMYKNTFRAPSFNDLYYLRVGNKGLRPEKATEYNIGLTWSGQPCKWFDFVSITADGYYNVVDDKIVAFPSAYIWKMANYGKVHITGIDITLATQMPISDSYSLRLTGNYTYQRAIDVTDPTTRNYKNQLPYTPQHNGNASLVVRTPWLNIGYTLTGVSHRYFLSENIEENKIDGYVEHTISLTRDFTFRCCQLHLSAELVNITDEQYQIIKYYPMPGRNVRFTANIKF